MASAAAADVSATAVLSVRAAASGSAVHSRKLIHQAPPTTAAGPRVLRSGPATSPSHKPDLSVLFVRLA